MCIHQKSGRRRGRDDSANERHRKLLDDVKVAKRTKRLADRNYTQTIRRAQTAGLTVEDDEIPDPEFKVLEDEIHIFMGGRDPKHSHGVMKLADKLSEECLAELADKLLNGRVVYDRPYGEKRGWWNYRPSEELVSMAAD